MADKQSTKPPSGTRDFLPGDVRRREYVIDVVRRVYERYGFEPLETPAFENIDTLLGKYGEEGNKLIFKILKRGEHEGTGEADLALRYDLTVPLARVVAQYQNELPKFFKRYQIQPVWRADRPARGRFREFYQCDIDSMGSTSPIVDVEILSAVSEVLVTLGFDDFTIRLNHRQLLAALLESVGVSAAGQSDTLVALDKLDKTGPDAVIKDLESRGFDHEKASRCVNMFASDAIRTTTRLPSPSVFAAANMSQLSRLHQDVPEASSILDEVQAILDMSADTQAAGHVLLSRSLARGLSYYTGAIMEVGVEGIGSLGGGGRYDNLIGMFLGRDVPACGFSLGLERIIVVMTERNMFKDALSLGSADVLVTMWPDADDAIRRDALALASELRAVDLRVDVYPEPDKLGKQLRYASDRDVQFAVIVGGDERAKKAVTIKDLVASSQETVARESAPQFIRERVDAGQRTKNPEP
ncbi:MAG: histidine--tRNA ligase [Acidobacteria bacterium]|nr:histidine--tRNA ligase [Acidobacteriota bacterium]